MARPAPPGWERTPPETGRPPAQNGQYPHRAGSRTLLTSPGAWQDFAAGAIILGTLPWSCLDFCRKPLAAAIQSVSEPLFIALLASHLLAVNLAAAGPLVSLFLEWASRKWGAVLGDEVARRLSRDALVAFAVGAVIGGAFLAVLWRNEGDPFVVALLRFSAAKLWFAGGELVFYVLCQGAYVAMWRRPWKQTPAGRVAHRLLAILAATNLLYHFPPMMAVIGEIAAGKLAAPEVIDAAAYRELAFTPAVASRSLHHILAAVALAGLYAAIAACRLLPRSAGEASRIAAWGARIALIATVLQIPVGIWVLLSLENNRALMGDSLLATALFIVAVVAALALMHHLAAIAFGDVTRKAVLTAAALFVFVVVTMTATLVFSRAGARPKAFSVSAGHVRFDFKE